MNFNYNTPYSSLDLAKNIAIDKSAVLIYCYWTDNVRYQRYSHCDSFVFYNFDNIQNFIKYLVWYIKKIIKNEKYEFEDVLSTDKFNVTIDGIFEIRCVNFPKELVIDSDETINLFNSEFKNYFELKMTKQIINKKFYIVDKNFRIIQEKKYENCNNNYLFAMIKEFQKIIINNYIIERKHVTKFYNDDSQKSKHSDEYYFVDAKMTKKLGWFNSEKDNIEKLKNTMSNYLEQTEI